MACGILFFKALVLYGCCLGVFMIYSLDGVTGWGKIILRFGIWFLLAFSGPYGENGIIVNVDHIDRFLKEFGNQGDEDSEDELSQHTHGNSKAKKSSKPSDFLELFGGKRDEEDQFMFGIKFTRRSIKLYSDFYSSDVIVASPVRLIAASVEAPLLTKEDPPIRYSDEYARLYRQTIILGSYSNPDINALFNRHCINYQGKVKLVCEYKGVLPKVILQVRQIYERFDVDSIADADDARFDYFVKKWSSIKSEISSPEVLIVLVKALNFDLQLQLNLTWMRNLAMDVFPKIKDSVQGGIMLFISSYFEYVRIRNFLKSQDASFCLLGEYTQQSDISRARVWFFEGRRKIMLYTERAHFYYRYKIRGIQNLIVYSLPERKEFYPEIVNMLDGSHNLSCTVLFSRFDQFRGCAAFPHLRVREIVNRDGPITVVWPFPSRLLFYFFFWHPDRTVPNRHHHPYPLPLSVSPLIPPIGSCMGETYWRLWVARASNGLSLLSAHLFLSSGRQDLLRPLMFGGYQIWGLLLAQDSIDYPIFGADLSKLFFLKSPYHTRIAWHLLL
uniref:U3 small nucleolar RNA-associated protein 25 n=1 Tax=Fagus sylvatica TaxID=28930 RepID=A0A2N9IAE3_FAGSY